MSKLAKLAAVAAAVSSLGAHAFVIDDFSTDQLFVKDTVVNTIGIFSQQAAGAGTIVGGFRDLFVIETDTPPADNPSMGTSMDVFNGVLGFSNDTGQAGVGIIRWDGANASFGAPGGSAAATLAAAIASINTTGLGSQNMLSSGLGFVIDVISADAGFNFQLEAYSGANWSKFTTASLPGSGSYFIPFAAFLTAGGTGADFSNIGALQAIINYPGVAKVDVDLRISLAEAAEIPEPASLALVGLALVGLGAVSRRSRRRDA